MKNTRALTTDAGLIILISLILPVKMGLDKDLVTWIGGVAATIIILSAVKYLLRDYE